MCDRRHRRRSPLDSLLSLVGHRRGRYSFAQPAWPFARIALRRASVPLPEAGRARSRRFQISTLTVPAPILTAKIAAGQIQIPSRLRVCRKRERLPSSGSIGSDPARTVISPGSIIPCQVASDTALTLHVNNGVRSLRCAIISDSCPYTWPSGSIGTTSHKSAEYAS
jgi:hypothetical protein